MSEIRALSLRDEGHVEPPRCKGVAQVIYHSASLNGSERVEMLRCQSEPLPVYRYTWGGAWEYLGRYRVQDITDGGREAAERSKIRGRPH